MNANFKHTYWDLLVSASNQRLSAVFDKQKTSVTEATETKSDLSGINLFEGKYI